MVWLLLRKLQGCIIVKLITRHTLNSAVPELTHIHHEKLHRRQLATGCGRGKFVVRPSVGTDVKLKGLCLGEGLVPWSAAPLAFELQTSALGQGSTGGSAAGDTLPLGQQDSILGIVWVPVPSRLDGVAEDGLVDKARDRPASTDGRTRRLSQSEWPSLTALQAA
jgi:hypothetical protein